MTPQPLTSAEAEQLTEALLNDHNRERMLFFLITFAQTQSGGEVARALRDGALIIKITLKP